MKFPCIVIIILAVYGYGAQAGNGITYFWEPLHAPPVSCETGAFPPPKSDEVSKFQVDLDASPRDRWKPLMKIHKDNMAALVGDIYNLTIGIIGERMFGLINDSLPWLASTLPPPYYEEMQGIAEATELPLSEVTLFNVFYEIFTFCTSIVAQTPNGKLIHGRNLDFGLFLGWDKVNHTWKVAELLRPLIVQIEWTKGGETVFESVQFAGFIGVLTAVKKGAFSFSLDERFGLNGGYVGLLEWIIFKDHRQSWVTFLTREVMETATNYTQAQDMLSHTRLLAPVYFILAGTQKGEGCVITRYRDDFDLFSLGTTTQESGSWYLVETNYDHWKSVPFFDDRRKPAMECMNEGGQGNASFALVYNVLSTVPVLNKLTTYTSLMNADAGYLATWRRACPDPCLPW